MYARKRNVVSNGQVSLQELVRLTLHENLNKDPSVHLSKWSKRNLDPLQIQYAALDAIKSLEVFNYLHHLPDVTKRLTISEVNIDMAVTVAPPHGSTVCMLLSIGGYGRIVGYGTHLSPYNMEPKQINATESVQQVIVEVEQVLAPSLIIPLYKTTSPALSSRPSTKVYLGDFGKAPFKIVIPLKMLRQVVMKSYYPVVIMIHILKLMKHLQHLIHHLLFMLQWHLNLVQTIMICMLHHMKKKIVLHYHWSMSSINLKQIHLPKALNCLNKILNLF